MPFHMSKDFMDSKAAAKKNLAGPFCILEFVSGPKDGELISMSFPPPQTLRIPLAPKILTIVEAAELGPEPAPMRIGVYELQKDEQIFGIGYISLELWNDPTSNKEALVKESMAGHGKIRIHWKGEE